MLNTSTSTITTIIMYKNPHVTHTPPTISITAVVVVVDVVVVVVVVVEAVVAEVTTKVPSPRKTLTSR